MLYQDTGRRTTVSGVPNEFDVSMQFGTEALKRGRRRTFVYYGEHFWMLFVKEPFVEEQDPVFLGQDKRHFVSKTLSRDAVDSEVWQDARRLYTESLCVVTMAEVYRLVMAQMHGQCGFLLTDYKNNIFFVRDLTGQVRIVHVRYSKKYKGWGISGWYVEENEYNRNVLGWMPNRSQFIFRSR
jgi:hypothetical protein